ncbi:hypothetical protein D3C78_1243060 [compost metagenome]
MLYTKQQQGNQNNDKGNADHFRLSFNIDRDALKYIIAQEEEGFFERIRRFFVRCLFPGFNFDA